MIKNIRIILILSLLLPTAFAQYIDGDQTGNYELAITNAELIGAGQYTASQSADVCLVYGYAATDKANYPSLPGYWRIDVSLDWLPTPTSWTHSIAARNEISVMFGTISSQWGSFNLPGRSLQFFGTIERKSSELSSGFTPGMLYVKYEHPSIYPWAPIGVISFTK